MSSRNNWGRIGNFGLREPVPPSSPWENTRTRSDVFPSAMRYTGSRGWEDRVDYSARVARLRQVMLQTRIDLIAIPPGDDLHYLAGFSPLPDERPCYLFLSAGAGAFLVPSLNVDQAERHIRQPFLVYTDAHGPANALAEARKQFASPSRIGVGDAMRADALLMLQRLWPDAEYVPASEVLATLRMRKTPRGNHGPATCGGHSRPCLRSGCCRVPCRYL